MVGAVISQQFLGRVMVKGSPSCSGVFVALGMSAETDVLATLGGTIGDGIIAVLLEDYCFLFLADPIFQIRTERRLTSWI